MKRRVISKTLVLIAVGSFVGLGGSATVSAKTPASSDATCEIPDPETDVGAEVTMTLEQLENASVADDGSAMVTIEAANLSGIAVPADMDVVAVHLTEAEYAVALQLASEGPTGRATNAVHSDEWVSETEDALLGGFAVEFNGAACPYGVQTKIDDSF